LPLTDQKAFWSTIFARQSDDSPQLAHRCRFVRRDRSSVISDTLDVLPT
jgi:hypothetical protein